MYQAVYSEDALRQILALRPASKRDFLLRRIEQLAENPFTRGDFEVTDQTGRKNQVLVLSGIAITFRADHPVNEVRIVSVTTLPR